MGTVIWSIIIFSIVLRLEAAKFLKELRLLEKNIPSLFLQHLEQFYQMGYRLDTVWLIYKYFLPFDLTPEFQPSSGRFFWQLRFVSVLSRAEPYRVREMCHFCYPMCSS